MHIAPQGLFELRGGYDLAGVGKQKPKSSQFPGGKVNHRFTAKERSVGFHPKAAKFEGQIQSSAGCAAGYSARRA
jgi:hypothetical protein